MKLAARPWGWVGAQGPGPSSLWKRLCAEKNNAVPRPAATAAPETNSRPLPRVAPRTKEAAPRWQQAGGLHLRALWHRVAEGADRTSPSAAQHLQGRARTSLRPGDHAAPHPSDSTAGLAWLCPNPHLPSPLTALQTRAPGKSHRRGVSIHNTPYSVLVCPLGTQPRLGPLQAPRPARGLRVTTTAAPGPLLSPRKHVPPWNHCPPSIMPEPEQGN